MVDMWMPGAIRKSVGNTGAMTGGAAKATWHATSNINADGKDNAFYLESSYFAGGGKSSAPHLIWDPFTGEIAQYFPADSRALALRDYGSNRTNRSGKYNIQIEVVFAKGMTRGGKKYTNISETPCKNLGKIMAWLRSLGIKDTWPGGAPAGWVRDTVSWDTYHSKSGHYGHHQVPGNDHTDPGKMPNLFSTTSGGSTPTPSVPTGGNVTTHKVVKGDTLWGIATKYKTTVAKIKSWNGLKSDTISVGQTLKVSAPVATAPKPWLWFENVGNTSPNNSNKIVQTSLKKVGYSPGPLDGIWGPQTSAAYKKWQQKLYGVGPDADGKPGRDSMTKLGAKTGFEVRYKPVTKVTRSNYESQPEPSHDYTRVYWGGRLVNRRTARMLDNAVSIYGRSFSLTQGSYNRGGVSASAGTHDGGGAVDVNTNGHDTAKLNEALRMAGFASWYRYPPAFSPHIHGIAIGDREASSGAKGQVQEYFNGGDGLVGGASGRQGGFRWPNWADKYNR